VNLQETGALRMLVAGWYLTANAAPNVANNSACTSYVKPRVHNFSKILGATSNFWVPEVWPKARRTHTY